MARADRPLRNSPRSRLSTYALPLIGALCVGAVGALMLWWMLESTEIETYDPAKHSRVRPVTIDQAKLRECLAKQPAAPGQRGLQCPEAYVYERGQDFFVSKERLAPR